MRILHINSYYSGSRLYKNLYDHQVRNGLDIDVFVPVPSSSLKAIPDYGPYTTIGVNHSKFDRLFFHLKHKKILSDIVKEYDIENYSVIHAHSLFSNGFIAMKLKEKYGIPYIVAVRNTDVNVFFKRMIHLRKLGIRILENAENVIFLSKSYRDEVVNKYIPMNSRDSILKKTSVIPNGIDDFWLNNKGMKKALPDNKNLRLLFVGAVNKNKNIVTTIRAIKILIKEGMKVQFTVVGPIVNKRLYKYIMNVDFVEYIEPKPKEELLEIYRQNDIFVMPSIHESFGLVYAEALSQGLPVIYSRNQGFDGHFEDGSVGSCVSSKNTGEIAEKIIEIYKKYTTGYSDISEQSEKFNWDKISISYMEIYNHILHKETVVNK